MRKDLIIMACLAAFAVVMVASAGDPSTPGSSSLSDTTVSARSDQAGSPPVPGQGTEPTSDPFPAPAAAPVASDATDAPSEPDDSTCGPDCAAEAGYRWAQAREVMDSDDCSAAPESFVEGCRAYAEAQTQLGAGTDVTRRFEEP